MFIFTFICHVTKKKQCFGRDTIPDIRGNSLVDWVSKKHIANFNIHEETPITVDEKPVKEYTLAVDKISETLVKDGYTTKDLGDKIQERFKFSKKIATSFNDFGCEDMSHNFYSLSGSEKNVNNFWNKIINRAAVLIKGEKINNTVTFKIKRVSGQIKKRWAKLSEKSEMHTYWCTVNIEDCGLKPVKKYECKTVKVGSMTKGKYERRCEWIQRSEYKCEKSKKQEVFHDRYKVYKHEFTDSWNKTEIEDMFVSVQKQIAGKLHF